MKLLVQKSKKENLITVGMIDHGLNCKVGRTYKPENKNNSKNKDDEK